MKQTLIEEDFSYFKKFLKEYSGYHLTESKKYLLESRLKPLLDGHKFVDYTNIVNQVRMNPKSDIALQVIEQMTINETFFFRDETPFKVFQEKSFPLIQEWAKTRKIKIWSAACSTGQEPYSIAMLLEKKFGFNEQVQYEIHASDISHEVIQRAKEGIYTTLEVTRGLSEEFRNKFFTEISRNKWEIKDYLKTHIDYFQQNLCDDRDNFKGPYDIVFLRNVLIYFDQDTKNKVLQKIAKTMNSDGFLFLGTSENIYDTKSDFIRDSSMTGVYRKK